MNGIRIVTGDVSDTATKVRSLNADIYEILQKMKADMNSLNGTWVSVLSSPKLATQFGRTGYQFR